MKKLESSLSFIDNISEWIGKIVSFATPIMMVVILIEIVGRELDQPTIWVHDLCAFMFGVYVVLSGSYALRHREHIRVDIVVRRLPRKIQVGLELFGLIFLLAFCWQIMWHGSVLAWESLLAREFVDSVWAPPLYPYKMAIAFGGFWIVVQGMANVIRDIQFVAGKRTTL